MQFDMFNSGAEEVIIDVDGSAVYHRDFLQNLQDELDDKLFDTLREELAWQQDQITLYGKTHNVPRLQVWYGDKPYTYSGIKLEAKAWPETLLLIKKEIESRTGDVFNSCLCNLYRNGQDYAAWHSDDEVELGVEPTIASISLGETRKIVFKHQTNKGLEKVEKNLEDKSLLLMRGTLQSHWKHQLSKTAKKIDERINLTFRYLV